MPVFSKPKQSNPRRIELSDDDIQPPPSFLDLLPPAIFGGEDASFAPAGPSFHVC
jgi:hypothetical protein